MFMTLLLCDVIISVIVECYLVLGLIHGTYKASAWQH